MHTAPTVGRHEDGVDVAPSRDTITGLRDRLVGDAVQGVTHAGVRALHEVRDRVDAVPHADVAVVSVAVVGETRAEQHPIAPVDTRGVADEHLGDVLPYVAIDRRERHDACLLTVRRALAERIERAPRSYCPRRPWTTWRRFSTRNATASPS